jgi:hypothetical protein
MREPVSRDTGSLPTQSPPPKLRGLFFAGQHPLPTDEYPGSLLSCAPNNQRLGRELLHHWPCCRIILVPPACTPAADLLPGKIETHLF